MDKTSALLVGAVGSIALFMTWRSLVLERRLSRTGGEIKRLKCAVGRLDDEKKGLEAALAESMRKAENYEKKLGTRQPEDLGHVLGRAKRSVKLCIPEMTGEVAAMLPKKTAVAVIAGTMRGLDKPEFPCATKGGIDLTLAIIDDKEAYRAEGGRMTRLQDTGKLIDGFDSLWNSAKAAR